MYLSVNKTYANFKSELAKKEKNDCVVRSVASAAEITYDVAHKFCKDFFRREDKKGTNNLNITTQMLNAEEKGLQIGDKHFDVTVLGKGDICNRYKLYGKIIFRQKTLKSFISSHPTGTYLVMIAKHALTVKDGEVYDWSTNRFKPTTKVMSAYKLEQKSNQLNLFQNV